MDFGTGLGNGAYARRKGPRSSSQSGRMGYKVREARKARNWTQTELAARVFSSTTRISDVERGIDPPDRELATKLAEVLDLGDDLLFLLRMMENREVRDYAKGFLRRQQEATQMHEFSTIVPGLLQTIDYALGSLTSGRAGDKSDIGRYAERRIERQRVWDREEPPWLWLVLDESVLYREMGSRKVMHGQLDHLLAMNGRPNVNIRVLPYTASRVSGYLSVLGWPCLEEAAGHIPRDSVRGVSRRPPRKWAASNASWTAFTPMPSVQSNQSTSSGNRLRGFRERQRFVGLGQVQLQRTGQRRVH